MKWEMFIRSQTTTLLQIFCEISLCSQVIFISMKVADVRFWRSSKCEWVNKYILDKSIDLIRIFETVNILMVKGPREKARGFEVGNPTYL